MNNNHGASAGIVVFVVALRKGAFEMTDYRKLFDLSGKTAVVGRRPDSLN
jgi:hypothetical protein